MMVPAATQRSKMPIQRSGAPSCLNIFVTMLYPSQKPTAKAIEYQRTVMKESIMLGETSHTM